MADDDDPDRDVDFPSGGQSDGEDVDFSLDDAPQPADEAAVIEESEPTAEREVDPEHGDGDVRGGVSLAPDSDPRRQSDADGGPDGAAAVDSQADPTGAASGTGDGAPAGAMTTVYVTGFPEDLLERELHNLCRFLPKFEGCSLLNNSRGGATGFVKFGDQEAAGEAIAQLDGIDYEGDGRRVVKAQFAKRELQLGRRKPKTPRRRGEQDSRYGRARDIRDRPRSPPPTRERSPPRERQPQRARSGEDRRAAPPERYAPPRDAWDAPRDEPRYEPRDHREADRRYADTMPPVSRYEGGYPAGRDSHAHRRSAAPHDAPRGGYGASYDRPPPADYPPPSLNPGGYAPERRPHQYEPEARGGHAAYVERYDDRGHPPPRADHSYPPRAHAVAPGRYEGGPPPEQRYAEPRYDDRTHDRGQPPTESRYDSRPPPRETRGAAGDLRDASSAKRQRFDNARDTLCVRGLDDKSNLEEIEQIFCKIKGYMGAKVQQTDRGQIAFVKFASEADAAEANVEMQSFVVQSEPLVVLKVEIARRSLSMGKTRQ